MRWWKGDIDTAAIGFCFYKCQDIPALFPSPGSCAKNCHHLLSILYYFRGVDFDIDGNIASYKHMLCWRSSQQPTGWKRVWRKSRNDQTCAVLSASRVQPGPPWQHITQFRPISALYLFAYGSMVFLLEYKQRRTPWFTHPILVVYSL